MIRRLLPWVAVAALVVAAVATAGWGGGSSTPARPSRSASSTPSRSPGVAPTQPSEVDAAGLVRDLVLRRTDLPQGFRAVTVARSTTRAGRHSLRLCGGYYPSEAYRIAVQRVAFAAPARAGGGRISDQVLVYSGGQAALAVNELSDNAPACTRAVLPDGFEQPGTLALHLRSTRRTRGFDLFVERRGDVLNVLRVDATERRLGPRIALLLGRRLETRLPA